MSDRSRDLCQLISWRGGSSIAGKVAFDRHGDAVKFTTGSTGAQILFGAGKPTGRNNVWAGPFCLSSQKQANDAIARYQAGLMGTLTPSF